MGSQDLLLDQDWYHTIELLPGVYTPGQHPINIAVTRHILSRCGVEGARCLDVGTMDGLIAALLCRRGATQTIACDRYDRRAFVDVVKKCLTVDFTYVANVTLGKLRDVAPTLTAAPFDLIVFSGVLYHVYDPVNALALLRTMVRPGGLVVLETQCAVSRAMVGYFNSAGHIIPSDPHNYWSLSISLLDYLLRFLRFQVADCRYLPISEVTEDGCACVRLALACRAIDSHLPDKDDAWMACARDDDRDYPEWAACTGNAALPYQAGDCPLVFRTGGSVNLYETVTTTPPLSYSAENLRLPLGAYE